MPYVYILIAKEGATPEQKSELIEGTTDLLKRVLNKNPASTFVVIDEVETCKRNLQQSHRKLQD